MGTHYRGTEREKLALDIFIKLMRSASSVTERTARPGERAGLHASQFGVLETLYHLGPLMVSQLADKHLKSRNNFTVVIDNLEKQGLVRRERDTRDRRAVIVHLTDEGRERVTGVLPQFVAEVVSCVDALTVDEQKQLCELLKRLGLAAGARGSKVEEGSF